MSEKRKKKTSSNVVPLHPREETAIGPLDMYMGTIAAHSAGTEILVDYPGNEFGAIPARSAVRLSAEELDSLIASRTPVLLMFASGRSDRPLIMGLTQPIPIARAPHPEGETVVFRADERLEIRCGEASVVLTKEGKILINGTYVSVGSDGVLRLDGASVQLN